MFSLFKRKKEEKINIEENIICHYEGILGLLIPKKDPLHLKNFRRYPEENLIMFEYKSFSQVEVEKLIPLKSLELVTVCSNGDYSCWEADYEEYLDVYRKNEIVKVVREFLQPSLNLLIKYEKDIFFQNMISTYEISISNVFHTLKESEELNNGIPENLKRSVIEILVGFSKAIINCKKERNNFEERDFLAHNKSLNERIELELKYVTKFIENKN